jgi:LL-diaminopimelate aminotransferase
MLQPSQRLQNLGVYALAKVFAARDAETARGVDLIDLGVGNPDRRPPDQVVSALKAALDDTQYQNHRYPAFGGMPAFREAIARWYKGRFDVDLDPTTEVLPLIGSKEGIAKFFFAHLDPGDTLLMTTPCYPAYLGAASLNQVNQVDVPLTAANHFHPDLDAIPEDVARRAKILTLNYPQNPTGAVESDELYDRALAFARKNDVCIVSDIAYCDLPMDPTYRTRSFLEFDKEKTHTIEFHSFSKSYSMQGWRVGFAVGNSTLVGNLARIKANMDFSIFMALQRAAMVALETGADYCARMGKLYAKRRDVMYDGLKELGFEFRKSRAGMYLWVPIPSTYDNSMKFTEDLLKKTGVLFAPGSAFGASGEGYVRIAMCDEEERLREAISRLKREGISAEMAPASTG